VTSPRPSPTSAIRQLVIADRVRPELFGGYARPTAATSNRMRLVGRRDTPAEIRVRSLLHRLGYRFRIDLPPLPGGRRRADIVFTRQHVAVFLDGCFWHGCPTHFTTPLTNSSWWAAKVASTMRRDKEVDQQLRAAGWRVVRGWEHERVGDVVGRVVAALCGEAPARPDLPRTRR
jgi:DNA mismatch endonuclease, patch repair protein